MNAVESSPAQEVIRLGTLEIRYLQRAQGGTRMGMFEMRVPPGAKVPPPHSHDGHEELIYVLEGTLRYSVGGESRELGPGDSMATPCGVVHAFSNPHADPVRALVVNTPEIDPQYFRDVASVLNAGGPPDRAALFGVMQRYGLVPALPA